MGLWLSVLFVGSVKLSLDFLFYKVSAPSGDSSKIICHLPLRRRLGWREVALLLGHAGCIYQDPAPSCGSCAARTPQECGEMDTASTGRDLVLCPGFLCSHSCVDSGACCRFCTLKQNSFHSLQLLASSCLCIKYGSRPGRLGLFSWSHLKLCSVMVRNNCPLEKMKCKQQVN